MNVYTGSWRNSGTEELQYKLRKKCCVSIRALHKKSIETGCVAKKRAVSQRTSVRDIERIPAAFYYNLNLIRAASRQSCLQRSTVYRILRMNLRLYPYIVKQYSSAR